MLIQLTTPARSGLALIICVSLSRVAGAATLCLNMGWLVEDNTAAVAAAHLAEKIVPRRASVPCGSIFGSSLVTFPESGRDSVPYTRPLDIPSGWLERKCFLEFQGAMQKTIIRVNDT